ncbi:IS1634 family transposase [Mycoplasma sp. B6400]|uniref:IS1634 family transposase n=1 Tax=Mycoplasma sp. B6400 TaxID=3401674 RepID=UPI003AAA35CC
MSVGYQSTNKTGYAVRFGIGYEEDFDKYQENSVEKIKQIIKTLPLSMTKEEVINEINKKIKNKSPKINETYEKFVGFDLISRLIDYFDIFKDCKTTKSISLNDVVKQQIYQRIKNPLSVYATYKNATKEKQDFYSKNSFYRSLEYIADNRNQILSNVNETLKNEYKRDVSIVWFDSTTAYFETFSRDGYKKPGYSKDGKFKEDQIVIGLATDSNGIPVHYKVFPGNTADSSTFIPFILELQKIYNITTVTVIADKGMSVNKNIRFLEDKKLNYIISYRMKKGSKEFKEYVLSEKDYVNENGLLYKSREIISLYRNGRKNGHTRKQIITFSEKRAKKDYEDRKILIDNFNKKAKNGKVSYEDMVGGKKYRFFKPTDKSGFYELDYDKVLEDEKFDGFYVYETNRVDLKETEIVELYTKQWQAEENFRTLKGALSLRPMYLSTWKNIQGYICLCFLSLVMLKFLTYKINDFLGLAKKDKITTSRIITMINDVKQVEQYFDKKLINTVEIKNPALQQSWEDYQLILNIFNHLNIK